MGISTSRSFATALRQVVTVFFWWLVAFGGQPSFGNAQSLALEADLNKEPPILAPLAACSVNGRTFVAARELDSSGDSLTLFKASSPPTLAHVVARFINSSVARSPEGVLSYGCFEMGRSVAIPGDRGLHLLDIDSAVRFLRYPDGFSKPVRVFIRKSELFILGAQAELIKFTSEMRMEWMLEPLSTPLSKPLVLNLSSATFISQGRVVVLDLSRFTRRVVEYNIRGLAVYAKASRGAILIAEANSQSGWRARMWISGSAQRAVVEMPGVAAPTPNDYHLTLLNGAIFFVANGYEIWRTDGTIAGTKMIYQASQSEGPITALASLGTRLVAKGQALLALTSDGRSQVLAQELAGGEGQFVAEPRGVLTIVDQGALIQTDGTPNGTRIIADDRIDGSAKLFMTSSGAILSGAQGGLFQSNEELHALSYRDLAVSASSWSMPVGSVGKELVISSPTKVGNQIFVSVGDPNQVRSLGMIGSAWSAIFPIGRLEDTVWFADSDPSLHAFKSGARSIESQVIEGAPQRLAFNVIGPSITTRTGLVFLSRDAAWAISRGSLAARLLAFVPAPLRLASGPDIRNMNACFWSYSMSDPDRLPQQFWSSDGTAIGTTAMGSTCWGSTPYIRLKNGKWGVFERLSTEIERELWISSKSGVQSCSEAPTLLSWQGSYMIHSVCDGLWSLDRGRGTATAIHNSFVPWIVEHGESLYFAHRGVAGRGIISRLSPLTRKPEQVRVLDDSVSIGSSLQHFSSAASLSDRIVVLLNSVRYGLELFSFVDDLDDCPNDPDKRVPGMCGCGVADADVDQNSTVDCKQGASDRSTEVSQNTGSSGVQMDYVHLRD